MSTRAIITGGAGFIGGLLARRLLSEPIRIGGAPEIAIDELTLVDLVAPRADIAADPRVRSVMGDLQATLPEVGEADVIFHLAGAVSGAAEVDFGAGGILSRFSARRTVDAPTRMPRPSSSPWIRL